VQWCRDGDFVPHFSVLHFQRAACSTFQTCILNSHYGHTMCASMVDIQSPTAEIRRGKKKKQTTGQKYNAPPLHRAAITRHTNVETEPRASVKIHASRPSRDKTVSRDSVTGAQQLLRWPTVAKIFYGRGLLLRVEGLPFRGWEVW